MTDHTGSFPSLDTRRLRLRAIVDSDAEALFAIHSDRRWMALWGADLPDSVDQTRAVIAAWASWRRTPNPGTRWGIERRSDDRLVGTVGLFRWSRDWCSAMTSYELAPAAARQGLMSEALGAVLDWGWTEMELNRVEALVHPDNTASIALLHRMGFVQEGLLRQAARWDGEFRDLATFGLLRDDVRDV